MAGDRVTIKDVAKEVGCSIAVVSTVLNRARGNTVVSQRLRERVEQAAEQLGYRPHFSAIAMRTRRTVGIGIPVFAPSGEPAFGGYRGALMMGVEMAARERGQALVIIGESDPMRTADRAIQFLEEHRVGALVCFGFYGERFRQRIEALAGPVVWAPRDAAERHPAIGYDPAPGIDAAVAHLAQLGHRRIAWAQPRASGFSAERQASLLAACAAAGIACDTIDLEIEAGLPPGEIVGAAAAGLLPALRASERITALVTATELLAHGAYAACARLGWAIPERLSIIGFDDFRAHLMVPGLSVVSHMLPAIGRRAAELALDMADDGEVLRRARGRLERIPAHLVLRASTAAPHAA